MGRPGYRIGLPASNGFARRVSASTSHLPLAAGFRRTLGRKTGIMELGGKMGTGKRGGTLVGADPDRRGTVKPIVCA